MNALIFQISSLNFQGKTSIIRISVSNYTHLHVQPHLKLIQIKYLNINFHIYTTLIHLTFVSFDNRLQFFLMSTWTMPLRHRRCR